MFRGRSCVEVDLCTLFRQRDDGGIIDFDRHFVVRVVRVIPEANLVSSYLVWVDQAVVELATVVEPFVNHQYHRVTSDRIIPCSSS